MVARSFLPNTICRELLRTCDLIIEALCEWVLVSNKAHLLLYLFKLLPQIFFILKVYFSLRPSSPPFFIFRTVILTLFFIDRWLCFWINLFVLWSLELCSEDRNKDFKEVLFIVRVRKYRWVGKLPGHAVLIFVNEINLKRLLLFNLIISIFHISKLIPDDSIRKYLSLHPPQSLVKQIVLDDLIVRDETRVVFQVVVDTSLVEELHCLFFLVERVHEFSVVELFFKDLDDLRDLFLGSVPHHPWVCLLDHVNLLHEMIGINIVKFVIDSWPASVSCRFQDELEEFHMVEEELCPDVILNFWI